MRKLFCAMRAGTGFGELRQEIVHRAEAKRQAAPQRKVHATAETGAGRMLGKGRPEGRPDTACGFRCLGLARGCRVVVVRPVENSKVETQIGKRKFENRRS